jgi:hypothetical protein
LLGLSVAESEHPYVPAERNRSTRGKRVTRLIATEFARCVAAALITRGHPPHARCDHVTVATQLKSTFLQIAFDTTDLSRIAGFSQPDFASELPVEQRCSGRNVTGQAMDLSQKTRGWGESK